MSQQVDAFLSEIRLFAFNFAPSGWALCNGQILPIAQNQALFSLLGTTYGGNGITTFALPNLQSRVPLHLGQGPGLSPYTQGQIGGQEAHALILGEMPLHTHSAVNAVAVAATTATPAANTALAKPAANVGNIYGAAASSTTMAPQALATVGTSQPHTNLQPFLVLNFCIATEGIFPSRN